jgi:tetratricopeptide (TPR) repeat protein
MPKRKLYLIASLLLLPLVTGCPQMQTVRLAQDTPGDIDTLLEQNEFARVRNLTVKHPDIDTIELQARIDSLETAYEDDILAQAGKLKDGNELLNAVELLSGALFRIPHSTKLRELRTTIETQRVHQLRVNERNTLIARANYLLDRQRLYSQQVNLQAPGYEQRHEHAQQESERGMVSIQLLEHARYAMEAEELDDAGTCLALAKKLDEGADTAALQDELQAMKKTRQDSTRQANNVRKASIKSKNDRDEKDETEKLLATTQKALDANKLHDARDAFTKIPQSTSRDSGVVAVQSSLDQAVSTRVKQLIVNGDSLYRSDRIHEALKTWSEALSLDPNNAELRERTDRANRVLTNLEELKRQQQK